MTFRAALITLHLIIGVHSPMVKGGYPRVERALTAQAAEMATRWHTPRVRFGRSGLPVYLVPLRQAQVDCQDAQAAACHGVGDQGRPILVVGANTPEWTVYLSHEVTETLVDPYGSRYIGGRLAEVCDPVNGYYYLQGGVAVADWVTPAWFRRGSRGPWDWGQVLHRALQLGPGGYAASRHHGPRLP